MLVRQSPYPEYDLSIHLTKDHAERLIEAYDEFFEKAKLPPFPARNINLLVRAIRHGLDLLKLGTLSKSK